MELSRLPPRVVAALALTVVALGVLGVRAMVVGDGGDDTAGASSTTSSSAPTTSPPAAVTTSLVEILPDWFPKQTSRYSEREPVVSLTTVPTTSSTVPDDGASGQDGSGSSGVGSGSGSGSG